MNKLILLSLAFVCLWLSAGVQASAIPETEEDDAVDLDEGELAADEEFDWPDDGEDEQNDEEGETELVSEVGRASGNRCGKKKVCETGYSCVRRCKSRCVASTAMECITVGPCASPGVVGTTNGVAVGDGGAALTPAGAPAGVASVTSDIVGA